MGTDQHRRNCDWIPNLAVDRNRGYKVPVARGRADRKEEVPDLLQAENEIVNLELESTVGGGIRCDPTGENADGRKLE